MRSKHCVVAVAIVACLAAFAPSAMGAARFTASSTASGQSFQGVNVGNHQFRIGSNLTTTCTGATFTGTTPTASAGPAPNGWSSLSFAPAYTGCSTTVAGIGYASTVTCRGSWTIDGSASTTTFNASTGATTGGRVIIPLGSSCVQSISGTSCTYTFGPQTISNGISGQNRTANDASNAPPVGAAAGSRVVAASTGISRTGSAGCSSWALPTGTASDGQYYGTVAIRSSAGRIGIWATN